jgi:hypothetical protein
VPLIFDLLDKEEDRKMIALLVGPTAMARAFAAPPGLSPARRRCSAAPLMQR